METFVLPVPPAQFRCPDSAAYARLVGTIDELNRDNGNFILKHVIASGPEDLEIDTLRWVEVYCGSKAKIMHLIEVMKKLKHINNAHAAGSEAPAVERQQPPVPAIVVVAGDDSEDEFPF